MLGLQSRPYLQASEAIVPPPGQARDEASIYTALARAAGAPLFGSWTLQLALEAAQLAVGVRRRVSGEPNGHAALPQRALLSLLLRACGQPSFDALGAHPNGIERHPHAPDDFLGKRVLTPDGLVDLAPKAMLDAARGLDACFARERNNRHRLKLISKRAVTSHNSWTHNHDRFTDDGTNHLYMHPEDAARAGLSAGALCDVRSATGVVRLPVRIHPELSIGTVALPHGWGHQGAPLLRVASHTRGVNVNLLAADGPDNIEAISGMAHLTGIVVDVRPAAGPLAHDWSGIAPEV
jgi:formate dehydrogenase